MTAPTRAVAQLQEAGAAFTLHEYEHDPRVRAFGTEAATALGRDPEQVFKTLIVTAGANDLAVAVIPVAQTLSLKQMAKALGVKKSAMAQVNDAERATGYVAGGISPLGQRRKLPTVIHASALEYATILVSGGRRGLNIEVSPEILITLTHAHVSDLTEG